MLLELFTPIRGVELALSIESAINKSIAPVDSEGANIHGR